MTTRKSTNGTNNDNGAKAQSNPAANNAFVSEAAPSSGADTFSQVNREEILQLIAILHDKFPELRDLTAEERKSLAGMGDKNRAFAGKVLEVILQDSSFLPRSFDIQKFRENLATFDDLSAIALALTRLLDLINATMIAIGSEAYDQGLAGYRYANASGQGASLEAMKGGMKQRFAQQGKKKDKDKEAEKPEVKE